jgi:hypothetical protein
MARRKYINGIRRHPSQFKQYKSSRYGVGSSKSPMLHDSSTTHQHSDKLEITLLDSVYNTSRTNPTLVAAGYDPNSRVTTHKDGTTSRGTAGGSWASGSSTTVSKIPDNYQQMGKETKDNTFSRNMLAPEDYF